MSEQTDVRATPPVGARLTGSGTDDLEAIADRRPLPQAIDALEHEIDLLGREVENMIVELGPVLSSGEDVGDVQGVALPAGTSPLRDRMIELESKVGEIRNEIARTRGRLEV